MWHVTLAFPLRTAKSHTHAHQGAVIQESVLKGSGSFVWSDMLLLLCLVVVSGNNKIKPSIIWPDQGGLSVVIDKSSWYNRLLELCPGTDGFGWGFAFVFGLSKKKSEIKVAVLFAACLQIPAWSQMVLNCIYLCPPQSYLESTFPISFRICWVFWRPPNYFDSLNWVSPT